MRTKKVRLISAAMAGGLVLTGVTAAAIASTSHAPTRVTLAADKTSSAVNLGNCPTLVEGDHGGCVNQLQTELNADDGDNLPVIGTFGPATRAAVIAFQQEHHIVPAEGTVGPQTKAALDNPGSSSAAPPAGQLNPGQRITSGTQIASPDGRFVLQMQSDGNLVLRAPGNVPLGDTHTAGHDGTIAVMQADGNFVLRAPGNIPVWSSGTDGHPGTVLQVQDDGGVVLYGPGHQVLRVLFSAPLPGSTAPTTPGPEPLPATPGALPAPTEYVALGDSFSSGEGNPSYDQGTDVPTDQCHRSPKAYPHLLAETTGEWSLGPNDFVACSGSLRQNVVYGQTSQTFREGTQLNKLNSSTGKVTISIGGNDVDFPSVLEDCLYGVNSSFAVHGSRDCADKVFTGDNSTQGMTLVEYERQLVSKLGEDVPCTTPRGDPSAQCSGPVPSLAHLYELIQQHAPHASIYVLLYPHLFNDEPGPHQCDIYGFGYGRVGSHIFISQANQRFINAGVDQLDTEIISHVEEARAAGVNVTYIDPRLRFDDGGQGHGVCSDHPWINGLHLHFDGQPAPESFHPNAAGQAAFADAIQHDLR